MLLGLASKMPKYSARRAFLWQLIAKNKTRRLALHTALRTVYQRWLLVLTERLLQIGNSHLKHLHLVFMKHERHISITLSEASSDFWQLTFPGRETVFVQRMLVMEGENNVWQMRESVFLWRLHSPSHLNQLLARFLNWVQRVFRTAFADTPNHCPSIALGKSNLCWSGIIN